MSSTEQKKKQSNHDGNGNLRMQTSLKQQNTLAKWSRETNPLFQIQLNKLVRSVPLSLPDYILTQGLYLKTVSETLLQGHIMCTPKHGHRTSEDCYRPLCTSIEGIKRVAVLLKGFIQPVSLQVKPQTGQLSRKILTT